MTERLEGWGIKVGLPPQWEGRAYLRDAATAEYANPRQRALTATGVSPGASGWKGEAPRPVVHLANYPLPSERGDYGGGALTNLTDQHIFVSLLDFGPQLAGTALFSASGFPRFAPRDFSASALQQLVPGQLGSQRFFTVAGRPLCLFVVVGGAGRLGDLCRQVNQVVAGIEVSP